jgi:hypothetical protein
MSKYITKLKEFFMRFKRKPTLVTTNIIQAKDWTTLYTGYGSVKWDNTGVTFAPMQSTEHGETHACMILKNNTSLKDFSVKFKAKTTKQLRLGSIPNAWECFWFSFNYVSTPDGKKRSNYLVLKPNGIEVGTMGGEIDQVFLFTASSPKLVIGEFNNYELRKLDKNLILIIDGQVVLNKTFDNLYDQAGTFGLYSEDAECVVESVI